MAAHIICSPQKIESISTSSEDLYMEKGFGSILHACIPKLRFLYKKKELGEGQNVTQYILFRLKNMSESAPKMHARL